VKKTIAHRSREQWSQALSIPKQNVKTCCHLVKQMNRIGARDSVSGYGIWLSSLKSLRSSHAMQVSLKKKDSNLTIVIRIHVCNVQARHPCSHGALVESLPNSSRASATAAPSCRPTSRSVSRESRPIWPDFWRNRQFQRSSLPTISPPLDPLVSRLANGVCSNSSVLAASILLSRFFSSLLLSMTSEWPICTRRRLTEMS